MADTSQNARALRPTKRTDVKGRAAAPDADASVRGQEETETHTSERGAARVAARKAAHEKRAEAEKAQKAAEKASRGFKFWKKRGVADDGQSGAGETGVIAVPVVATRGAGTAGAAGAGATGTAGATGAAGAANAVPAAEAAARPRPVHRSKADERALRFATAGGRGDLSSSHADPTAEGNEAQATGSSRRHAAAEEKTFDFTGAANSVKDFCRRHLVIVIVLVAIAAVVLAVYPPAKTYYVAWRTGSDLQVTYDNLSQSNENLQSDLERLQTKEGIEDEARKKGYVSPGETAVNVEGLPDDSATDQTQEEKPWYIQWGDVIFGYTAS